MGNLRIGNDYNVAWSILKKGAPYNLEGLKATLYLKDIYGRHAVSGFSIQGNMVLWPFMGKDQKHTGKYSLELVINEGEPHMITTDYCNFVNLVFCDCKADSEDDVINIESELGFVSMIVDNELNEESDNAVANRPVAKGLRMMNESLETALETIDSKVNNALGKVEFDLNNTIEKVESDIERVENSVSHQLEDTVETVENSLAGAVSKVETDLSNAMSSINGSINDINTAIANQNAEYTNAFDSFKAEYEQNFADTKYEISSTLEAQTSQYTKDLADFKTEYEADYAAQKKAIDDKIDGQAEAIHAMVEGQLGALDSRVGALEEIHETLDVTVAELVEKKVDAMDYAPQLTAGFADNLVSKDVVVDKPFTLRRSGDGAISDGTARMEVVKGNSVVWNQQLDLQGAFLNQGLPALINNSTLTTTKSIFDWKVNAEVATRFWVSFPGEKSIPASHKYLLLSNCSYNLPLQLFLYNNNSSITIGNSGENRLNSQIVQFEKDGTLFSLYTPFSNTISLNTTHYLKGSIQIIDLTQMFGSGNEPTSVEEFYARCPQNIDLYAYNEGEIISTKVDAVKSVGRNIWDEQWESGRLDSANGYTLSGEGIRAKDFTPCLPMSSYYISVGAYNGGTSFHIAFYDKEKRYISGFEKGINRTFTTPSNACYLRFGIPTSSVISTYNHDICINLSDADFNGKYEPYREDVRELPSKISEVFPNGMRSANNAFDLAYNDLNKGVGVCEKRMGEIDLGDLSWTYLSDQSQFVSETIVGMSNATTMTADVICDKYPIDSQWSPDYAHCRGRYGQKIYLVDPTYTSAASLKETLNGLKLIYPLAEPIITEHNEPFNLDYQVTNGGTEEAIANEPSAPFRAEIAYGFNASAKIKENASKIAQLEAMLSQMQMAMAQMVNATKVEE